MPNFFKRPSSPPVIGLGYGPYIRTPGARGFADPGVRGFAEGDTVEKKRFRDYQPEGMLKGTIFDFIPDAVQTSAYLQDRFGDQQEPEPVDDSFDMLKMFMELTPEEKMRVAGPNFNEMSEEEIGMAMYDFISEGRALSGGREVDYMDPEKQELPLFMEEQETPQETWDNFMDRPKYAAGGIARSPLVRRPLVRPQRPRGVFIGEGDNPRFNIPAPSAHRALPLRFSLRPGETYSPPIPPSIGTPPPSRTEIGGTLRTPPALPPRIPGQRGALRQPPPMIPPVMQPPGRIPGGHPIRIPEPVGPMPGMPPLTPMPQTPMSSPVIPGNEPFPMEPISPFRPRTYQEPRLAGNIPGFGDVFSVQTGVSGTSNYVDASGNPLPREITSEWRRGRHGELLMPQEYKTPPTQSPYPVPPAPSLPPDRPFDRPSKAPIGPSDRPSGSPGVPVGRPPIPPTPGDPMPPPEVLYGEDWDMFPTPETLEANPLPLTPDPETPSINDLLSTIPPDVLNPDGTPPWVDPIETAPDGGPPGGPPIEPMPPDVFPGEPEQTAQPTKEEFMERLMQMIQALQERSQPAPQAAPQAAPPQQWAPPPPRPPVAAFNMGNASAPMAAPTMPQMFNSGPGFFTPQQRGPIIDPGTIPQQQIPMPSSSPYALDFSSFLRNR